MKHKIKPSKAQSEVWEWKEKAGNSLLDLPPELWLKTIHARTKASMSIIQTLKKDSAKKLRRVRVTG